MRHILPHLLVLAFVLGACAEIPDVDIRHDTPASAEVRPIEATDASESRSEPGRMAKADLGEEWPLTVDGGRVECIDGIYVVFHADDGRTYALNGAAQTHTEYPDIDPIWRDDPSMPDLKISIQPLLEAGRALCD